MWGGGGGRRREKRFGRTDYYRDTRERGNTNSQKKHVLSLETALGQFEHNNSNRSILFDHKFALKTAGD